MKIVDYFHYNLTRNAFGLYAKALKDKRHIFQRRSDIIRFPCSLTSKCDMEHLVTVKYLSYKNKQRKAEGAIKEDQMYCSVWNIKSTLNKKKKGHIYRYDVNYNFLTAYGLLKYPHVRICLYITRKKCYYVLIEANTHVSNKINDLSIMCHKF